MRSELQESSSTLRNALFDAYRSGQSAYSSSAVYRDLQAFWPHYEANYGDVLVGLAPTARIVDIGCGPGSLVAWLQSKGFEDVVGVDLSPGDVEYAAQHLGPGVVRLEDGREHLAQRPQQYDRVFMKAVLEHVPKSALLPLLEAAAAALSSSGRLVIEVPNMDWVAACHERYMDLTHEVGFTAGSLRSLLTLLFTEVAITGSRLAQPTRSQRWLRPLLTRLVRRALYVLGEGASETLFAHRSLIATAGQPRPIRKM